MISKDEKNNIFKKSSERGKILEEKPNVKNDKIVNKADSSISKSKNTTFNINNNEINKPLEKLNNNAKLKLNEILTFKSNQKKLFMNYIFFRLTCEKNNRYFHIYKNLRMKILSEQHLI